MNEEQGFYVPADSSTPLSSVTTSLGRTPEEYRQRLFRAVTRISIYTLALLGFAAIVREFFVPVSTTDPTSTPRFVSCSCGRSVREAIANGCKYDLLASAWLPEQCRDDELTAEFSASGPGPNGEWTYVSDFSAKPLVIRLHTVREIVAVPFVAF